jgi:c(7)-type cytochrome triheme protein
MKKLFVAAFVVVLTLALSGLAFASMKTLVFPDGAMGKVTFDGKMHNAKLGHKCMECHGKGIPMKAPGTPGALKFTMADIYAGKVCGMCHNGTRAFNVKGNCGKCHKK